MATPIDDLLPEIVPECPGVPDPLATLAVRRAAREFCRRSTWWRESLAAIDTVAGTASYTLAPASAESMIVSVVDPVMHVKEPVYRKTRRWLGENAGLNWDTNTGEIADYYLMTDEKTLRLVPIPTVAQTGGLEVTVVLQPTPTATNLDTDLYNQWYEAIAYGAKAYLQVQTDKPWSSPQDARVNAGLFEDKIHEAFSRVTAGNADTGTDRHTRTVGVYF